MDSYCDLNENDMLATAEKIGKTARDGGILFLRGMLGAGKTTFCRGVLAGMGYNGRVKSPSYTLIEPYTIDKQKVFHIDLYRITHSEELELMGLRDCFDYNNFCLVEWPEHSYGWLPQPDMELNIMITPPYRRLYYKSYNAKGQRLCQCFSAHS